jgi:ribonucleoside-diphosphate reductase alpha chain
MHEYIRTVIVNHTPEGMELVTPKWYEGEWCETDMFKFTKEGDEEILRGEFNGTVYKIDKNRGLTKEVLCEDYGVRQMKRAGTWDPSADWAVTAMSLSVSDHVNDLKGFARWVDSSMSKTVNVPNDYPFEDFKKIYTDTYASGVVKGVTTYRAGTMTTVLAAKDDASDAASEIILDDIDLPDSLPAIRKKLRAENKKWYMTISFMDDRPVELFVQTNHHEKTATTHDAVERLVSLARTKGIPERHVEKVVEKIAGDSNISKLARCISFLLRHGVLIRTVVSELDHVDNVFAGSFLFAIRKYLASFIKDGEKIEGERCQECGSDQVVYSEGCHKCVQCGSSKCG